MWINILYRTEFREETWSFIRSCFIRGASLPEVIKSNMPVDIYGDNKESIFKHKEVKIW